jgi:hypothetical protein
VVKIGGRGVASAQDHSGSRHAEGPAPLRSTYGRITRADPAYGADCCEEIEPQTLLSGPLKVRNHCAR